MKFKFGFFLCCYLFSLTGLFSQALPENVFSNQLFVKLVEGESEQIPVYEKGKIPELSSHFESLRPILSKFSVNKVKKAFITRSEVLDNIYHLEFKEPENGLLLLRELEALNFVEYAEGVPKNELHHTPDDLQVFHWHFFKVNAEAAWDISLGSDEIIVAVVDDGLDLNHEDLVDNLWVNSGEIPNNNMDDDNNGYVDDVNGYDSGDGDGDPNVPNANFSHGTHVGGTMSAVSNNGKGVPSLAYKSKIMACKSKKDSNTGTLLDNTFGGMDYAISNGANVVNMSFGGGAFSAAVQSLIYEGNRRRIVFVASAGNNGNDVVQYPSGYANVISVGSTNSSDSKSGFSSYGSAVDVMAPGSGIYSTVPFDSYMSMSGTSMSSPFAASLCALILSVNPYMTPEAVEDVIEAGCDNIDAQNSSFVGQIGAGRINAANSLGLTPLPTAPSGDFSIVSDSTCGAVIQFLDQSQDFPLSWSWDFGDGGTSTEENPEHNFGVSGTFSVQLIVENPEGLDTIEKSITVTSIELPQIQMSQDTGGCLGDEFQLSAFTSGAQSYSWSPSSGLDQTDIANPTVSVISNVEYVATVLGPNGCIGQDTVMVTMHPYPAIYAGADVDIITNSGSAQLNAIGANTYSWSPPIGLSCTDCADPIADPDSTTEYTVVGTSEFGCSREDKIVVNVNIVGMSSELSDGTGGFTVFPNPTQRELDVVFDIPEKGNWELSLVNLEGQSILNESLGFQLKGTNQFNFRVEDIPSGFYLVRISSAKQTFINKVLISR